MQQPVFGGMTLDQFMAFTERAIAEAFRPRTAEELEAIEARRKAERERKTVAIREKAARLAAACIGTSMTVRTDKNTTVTGTISSAEVVIRQNANSVEGLFRVKLVSANGTPWGPYLLKRVPVR